LYILLSADELKENNSTLLSVCWLCGCLQIPAELQLVADNSRTSPSLSY